MKSKNTSSAQSEKVQQIDCRGKKLSFATHTLIMGIVNVTPDSFSDGNDYFEPQAAINRALDMQQQGADIIDIGGESTRPGSERISVQEELARVMPVIEELVQKLSIPISIDTYRAKVAEQALLHGALIINDISALNFDRDMASVAAQYDVPVILMHIKGEPKTMQENPYYEDVIQEITQYFEERIECALKAGIKRQRLILDPGIGFGKRVEDNYAIIRRLDELLSFQLPILVGPSRKSFIGAVSDLPPKQRLEGTLAAVTACALNGAHIVRMHDVHEVRRALDVADAISGKKTF